MRRALLGGTFDPPHLAHLVVGEAALTQLGVEVVTFIPAGRPWQKADRSVSDADHRWAMTVLAVGGRDGFEADQREVRRDGWTYTVDTLETFPDDDEIVLVLGADAARNLPSWHRSDRVLDRTEIAVAPRGGVGAAEIAERIGPHEWLDIPEIDLSGTMLRDRVRRGRSIRYLVPEPVRLHVIENALYLAHQA